MKKNESNTPHYIKQLESCINCKYKCGDILFPNDLTDKCDKYEKDDNWIVNVLNKH